MILADLEQHIKKLVQDQLTAEEFLVDVIISGGNAAAKISILIDGDEGINIDRCAEISRKVGYILETEETIDHAYVLEVSSPGLDHPLKLLRQYKKNIGRKVKVQLMEDGERTGELLAAEEDHILIRERKKEKGSKKVTEQEVTVPFSDIKRTKVLVSFK